MAATKQEIQEFTEHGERRGRDRERREAVNYMVRKRDDLMRQTHGLAIKSKRRRQIMAQVDGIQAMIHAINQSDHRRAAERSRERWARHEEQRRQWLEELNAQIGQHREAHEALQLQELEGHWQNIARVEVEDEPD